MLMHDYLQNKPRHLRLSEMIGATFFIIIKDRTQIVTCFKKGDAVACHLIMEIVMYGL